jgi:SAM-dependent methyltransferase
VLNLPSRRRKGLKIERLLELQSRPSPILMLEIGTGSGGIAHYFATHPSLTCNVISLDVVDQRQITDGYKFMQIPDTELPFEDASFDVVLTNHVIEHVGDETAQLHHLAEIYRVLKGGAIVYLATPNRWMLIEPHFRLAFLGWLPPRFRTPYLHLMQHGKEYDCNPPSQRTLERLLKAIGFTYDCLGTRGLHEVIAIEGKQGWLTGFIASLPDALLDRLSPLNPTLIYRLSKS